ncbi:MAG: formate/nitrite transporter family protein [Acidimicrobiales bacterium]
MTVPQAAEAHDDALTPTGPPRVDTGTRPREEDIERSFDRILAEGQPRLHRSVPDLLATGGTAGMEVTLGVLALLYVDQQTGSGLLGGLAFSIGFIALRLGHSELFTEGFLVPVTVVVAGGARFRHLIRFWVGTLIGNLAGGWLVAWLIMEAFPTLHRTAIETGTYYIHGGINGRTFCLGLLGGSAITLLTRMHNGTDSEMAKLMASVGIAFLLAGVRLFHSVLDSLFAFTAFAAGRAPFGYLDWLGWFAWAVLGNLVGGLALTSVLRLVRSRHRVVDHRVANERPVPRRSA